MSYFNLTFALSGDSGNYQKAYEMEKSSTLFAIPLYEQTLQSTNANKLQRAAVGRLFYLYKKHNKVLEALFLAFKYPYFVSTKEKANIWKKLTEIYRPISYQEVTSAYALAMRATLNNHSELLELIHSAHQPKLFEFIYIILLKKKKFEILASIFEEDRTLLQSPLYEGVVMMKINPEKGKAFLQNESFDRERDLANSSDLLYLMGVYFRSLGNFEISARYFRMSSSFHWPERGNIESAKSLVLAGKFSEACSTYKFSNSPNEEVGQLFYLVCSKKDKVFLKKIKRSLVVLGNKEGGDFFQKVNQALDRWQ